MLRLFNCSQIHSGRALVFRPATRRCYTTTNSTASPKPFEILYFGRDEFSCTVLEELHAAQDVWQSISIVTQPDMKVGRRGSQVSISPLKLLAERLQLDVHTIPAERAAFRHWQPPAPFSDTDMSPSRLLVTASFGRILSNSLLHRFAHGRRLNVHPSLLPAYRGPAPIQHALMDGLKETGVCVIEMTEFKKGIDAGEIWGVHKSVSKYPIPEDAAFPELRDQLAVVGGRLLVSVLRQILTDTASSVPQASDANARRAPLITADDARVDFQSMTASAIVQRHKAVAHQQPIFSSLKIGKRLQFHGPVVLENPSDDLLSAIPEPGLAVYEPQSKSLVIRCTSNTVLSVSKVQQQDKKALDARSWWNGVRPEMRKEPSSNNGPILFLSQT
ncbi:Formyltransferase [Trametopsis cervina]|nr:Formyltransferase [Trametopsis cervina]